MPRSPKLFFVHKEKLVVFSAYLISLGLIVYSFNHTYGDFEFYFNAAQRVGQMENPYFSGDQLTGYFNGPVFAFLLWPLTLLGQDGAVFTWRVATVLGSLFLVYRLKQSVNDSKWILLIPIFLISFPTRNNLANTSLVVFQLLIMFYADKKISRNQHALGALFLFVSFELKPYLSLVFLILLLIAKKWLVFIYLLVFAGAFNVLYYIYFRVTYWDWLDALTSRSGGWKGADQSTLRTALWKYLGIPEVYATIGSILFFGALVLIAVWIQGKPNFTQGFSNTFILAAALGALFPLYSHEQDFVLSLFVLLILVSRNKVRATNPIAFGSATLLLGWTNIAVLPGLGTGFVLVWAVSRVLSVSNWRVIWLMQIAVAAKTYLLIYVLKKWGSEEQFYLHNFSAFVFGLLVFLLVFNQERQPRPESPSALQQSRTDRH
jgi:hypothetical protein